MKKKKDKKLVGCDKAHFWDVIDAIILVPFVMIAYIIFMIVGLSIFIFACCADLIVMVPYVVYVRKVHNHKSIKLFLSKLIGNQLRLKRKK